MKTEAATDQFWFFLGLRLFTWALTIGAVAVVLFLENTQCLISREIITTALATSVMTIQISNGFIIEYFLNERDQKLNGQQTDAQ
ncbi:MAG: hypothetical protein SFY92_00680 [Verrucomicrobiae bacterium]|nr:hypothetical protein [Verrucomicrobiae bacterium]